MGKEELLGTGQFECDGIDCGQTGTREEVDQHINDRNKDLSLDELHAWGSMEIGSQVWRDYHDKGIHPMIMISAGVGSQLSAQLQQGKNK